MIGFEEEIESDTEEVKGLAQLHGNNFAEGNRRLRKIEIQRTSDVFGRDLQEFRLGPYLKKDDVPLIFWLLAGYFRADTEKFKT